MCTLGKPYIKNIHQNIFAMEKEHNRELPFFDTLSKEIIEKSLYWHKGKE